MATAAPQSVDTPYDAILTNWVAAEGRGAVFLSGIVSKDSKGRFEDGSRMRSSPLATPLSEVRQGAIVQTLNTRYLLKSPASALTLEIMFSLGIFRLKPVDAMIQRQWAAVKAPIGYANLIDASIVHAATTMEIMRTGKDVGGVLAHGAMTGAIETMKAAKAILSSDMLDGALCDAEYVITAPDEHRSPVNTFIYEHVMPIIEKLEHLAGIGEDADAISRLDLGAEI